MKKKYKYKDINFGVLIEALGVDCPFFYVTNYDVYQASSATITSGTGHGDDNEMDQSRLYRVLRLRTGNGL